MFTDIKSRSDARDAAQRLLEKNIRLFDTETTDRHKGAEIIELAIVDASGVVLFNERFKPLSQISSGAFAVHGISHADLENEYPFNVYYDRIQHVINDSTMCAWNASFDVRMLKQTINRFNLKPYPKARVSCLMKLYALYSERRTDKVKLLDAVAELHLGKYNAHDALADTQAMRKVLERMAEGYEPELTPKAKVKGYESYDKRRVV